jgi:hypothetical protein
VLKKLKVGRSLGTRAIVAALKSSDDDLPEVLDGEAVKVNRIFVTAASSHDL